MMDLRNNKKIIFFAPYPAGGGPSQRFRYEQYKQYLEENDWEVSYSSFYSPKVWGILYKKGHYLQKMISILGLYFQRLLFCFQLSKYDVIFIHRETAPIGPPLFELIITKLLRRKYIYDFDDAIWLANYSENNAKFHWVKAYWKVNYCMKWATKVIAGNEYLANYARQFNKNVEVIPTTIDLEHQHNLLSDISKVPVVIGWTGTLTTMHYIDELLPVFKNLEKKHQFKFRVISNQLPKFQLDSLEYIPWNKETEIEDLARIQIGIMPLEDDQWAQGKCGFKALQYMALGIPAIVSPVGVNTTIIQHEENGFLASSLAEWEEQLEKLLQSQELRQRIGQAGRKTIQEKYSVEANKEKYLSILNAQIMN